MKQSLSLQQNLILRPRRHIFIDGGNHISSNNNFKDNAVHSFSTIEFFFTTTLYGLYITSKSQHDFLKKSFLMLNTNHYGRIFKTYCMFLVGVTI